jgi:predicted DNA-binding antitoxin AbrB/MazE fold protein
MTQLITVTFDGEVLKPEKPLNLEVNQQYQIQLISNFHNKENTQISLGEKLMKIRQKIVDSGVELLNEEEIEQEKLIRRGGWQED